MENIVFHLLISSLHFFLFGMINILVSNFVCIGYSNQGSFGCWDQNSIQPHSIKSDVGGGGVQGTQRISKKIGRSQQQKDYKGLECLFCLRSCLVLCTRFHCLSIRHMIQYGRQPLFITS